MSEHPVYNLVQEMQSGRINRRTFITRALALGISVPALIHLLAACAAGTVPAPAPGGAPAAAATAAPAEAMAGGSVRFLIAENFWADWEPYQSTAQSQARLYAQLYDRLVEVETEDMGAFSPGLAESWTQIDEQTWEFVLREGVKFHNGQDFTGEDVKASIERASGATDVQTVSAGEWVPTTVEVVDARTVQLTTATPFGPFFSSLAVTPIASAEDLAAGPETLKAAPNGTGPFRLQNDEPNRKTMVANADYWRGAPQIDELIWEFIQDPQTRLNALLAGQADAIDRVPPEHIAIIEATPELVLKSVTGIEQVNLWCRPGRSELWDTNDSFREAVQYSIDRASLVDNLVQGASTVATSVIPTLTRFHEPQEPTYSLDLDRARAALEAAGVPDGGPEFELWGATGFLPRAREVVESIADSMRQVGLNPKVVMTDVAAVIDDIFTDGGSGLMYHLSWSSNGDPQSAFTIYASPLIWTDGDARIDELFQAGAASTDDGERAEVYAELQSLLWGKMTHVPLYNSDFTVAHHQRLQGLRVLPNFATVFYPAAVTA
jgi:peptide/nickel transport system substrate-binding protein